MLHSQQGKKKKEPGLHSPVSFLQILILLIIYECSSTAVSNNENDSTTQSRLPCTMLKAPLKEQRNDTAAKSLRLAQVVAIVNTNASPVTANNK